MRLLIPMKFEITDDLIAALQGVLAQVAHFLRLELGVGWGVLAAGVAAVIAVVALGVAGAKRKNSGAGK